MNSDPSQPAPAPANTPPVSPRTSNLKSRWKRAPSAGAPSARPKSAAVFGEVKDVTAARESLTGENSQGYERAQPPPPRPATAAAAISTPVAPTPAPARPEPIRPESARPEVVRTEAPRASFAHTESAWTEPASPDYTRPKASAPAPELRRPEAPPPSIPRSEPKTIPFQPRNIPASPRIAPTPAQAESVAEPQRPSGRSAAPAPRQAEAALDSRRDGRNAPRDTPAEPRRESRDGHRESSADARREQPARYSREAADQRDAPRESPSEPRREFRDAQDSRRDSFRDHSAPARSDQNRRPPEGRSGDREQYVALKPDPANEPAPRRLRTEAARPTPVQEYKPSSATRPPDKTISSKHSQHEHRRSEPDSKSRDRVKPDAVIPARVAREEEETPKAKSRGILGFIKRIFTGDPVPTKKESLRRDHDDDDDHGSRHSGHNRDRENEEDNRRSSRHGHHHHHHHSSGRDRSSRPESRDERRDGRDNRDNRDGRSSDRARGPSRGPSDRGDDRRPSNRG